jgi:cytochrome c551/c552
MRRLWIVVLLSAFLNASPSGETLFQGNCLTCHDDTKTISAPAIKEVQARYKQTFETKESFSAFMVAWVSAPNAQTALMPQAVKKYGLMPLLGYDQESLEAIAAFLYEKHF